MPKITEKYCFVPNCTSSSTSTPNKVFFYVPNNEDARNRWFEAVQFGKPFFPRKFYYCCQDHFDLKEDMVDYDKYLLRRTLVKLKPNVVPHIFADKKITKARKTKSKKYCVKLAVKRLDKDKNAAKGQQNAVTSKKRKMKAESVVDANNQNGMTELLVKVSNISDEMKKYAVVTDKINLINLDVNKTQNCVTEREQNLTESNLNNIVTMSKPLMVDAACQCNIKIPMKDRMCSPIRQINIIKKKTSSISNFDIELNSIINSNSREMAFITDFKTIFETIKYINDNLKECIGIDNDKLFIIDILSNDSGCSVNDIKLTLMKIKTNISFDELGHKFNITALQAVKKFNNTTHLLAECIKKYIFTPHEMEQNLPNTFNEKYKNVYAIIDTFQVDFKTSEHFSKQISLVLNWEKIYNLKYLISCSPAGLVNFVSCGYGNKISDLSLFRVSNIMNFIPQNCVVMVNSEFDEIIETVLSKKNCHYISLPSVLVPDDSKKESLLIEYDYRRKINEILRKIRKYQMLAPNANLDLSFMPLMNNIVIIVTGIINFQNFNFNGFDLNSSMDKL